MWPLFLTAYACAPDPALPVDAAEVEVSRLAEGLLAFATAGQAELVLEDAEGLLLRAPDGALTPLALDAGLLAAARLPDPGLLVSAGELLFAVGELPQPSPLTEITGAPLALRWHDEALFIEGEDRVWRWRDGAIEALEVAAGPLTPPLAPGGRLDGRALAWARGPEGLVGVTRGGEGGASLPGVQAASMATDGEGGLWWVEGGALWRMGPAGAVTAPLGERAVDELLGAPGAPGVWLVSEGELLFATPSRALALGPAPEGELAVDDAGRLLALHEGVLERRSTALHLALTGLVPGERVWGQRALGAEGPLAASAELVVDGVPTGSLTLDAEAWLPGRHTLRLRAEADGVEALGVSQPFHTDGPLTVTWDEHVGPLYRDRCARCHDDGTTTRLGDAERFAARVDAVLEEVRAGRMPIGDQPLSEGEVRLIELWAEGGFP